MYNVKENYAIVSGVDILSTTRLNTDLPRFACFVWYFHTINRTGQSILLSMCGRQLKHELMKIEIFPFPMFYQQIQNAVQSDDLKPQDERTKVIRLSILQNFISTYG